MFTIIEQSSISLVLIGAAYLVHTFRADLLSLMLWFIDEVFHRLMIIVGLLLTLYALYRLVLWIDWQLVGYLFGCVMGVAFVFVVVVFGMAGYNTRHRA